ncbi:SPFH domain-containing protein [Streptomyces sp. NPDC007088]|uniref:SPFH domain-containing protein n=1 Tax=Streptomyces sp. NPDC007088 TaxID=3364773 RepID=UPI0036A22369
MSTTTPQDGTRDEDGTREGDGTRGEGARRRAATGARLAGEAPAAGPPRHESTMEIPVHLLFRDDPRHGLRDDLRDGPGGGLAAAPADGAADGAEAGPPDGPGDGLVHGVGGLSLLPPAAGPSSAPRWDRWRPAAPGRSPGARAGRGATEDAPDAGPAPGRRPGRPKKETAPWGRPRGGDRVAPVPSPDERPALSLPGLPVLAAGLLATVGAVGLLWRERPEPGPATVLAALLCGVLALFAFAGLERGRVGTATVLTLAGRYRGTVRRTGLLWADPLPRRRPVDVRLRHWRSEPMPAVDARGVGLRVVLLVVWRVADTARAGFAVEDHAAYLRDTVESAAGAVLARLPMDAPAGSPSLRDTEALGAALTRQVAADAEPVGLDIEAVRPLRLVYAPEFASAMHRTRIAALDADHREATLTTVLDAVEDTLAQLTARGLAPIDEAGRRTLVKDLTVAFWEGRGGERWDQGVG